MSTAGNPFSGSARRSAADVVGSCVFGDGFQQRWPDANGAGLVVFRVRLDDVELDGGGVLLRNLDDRLLDGQLSPEEVDVARPEGDEFSPEHPSLDEGLHHEPMPLWGRR